MVHLRSSNPHVFLDVQIGKTKAGRIIIELMKDVVPKTVANFKALCTGEKKSRFCEKQLHFKGSKFHRVVPQFLAQGGEIIRGLTGGESIYGPTFEDENFTITHEVDGIVGMANNGPNTNGSQFYITTVPCPHLDGCNVAFGKVIKGLNIVVEMSDVPRVDDYPAEDITIVNCGEILPGEPFNIEECDDTEDVYPPWPNDWDIDNGTSEEVLSAINKIKISGSHYFYKQNFIDAERKYKKGLRYIDWYILEKACNDKTDVEKIKFTLLLNLATVKLKLKKYKSVISICNQIIDNFPKNGKAYYRRAQARLYNKDYDKALNDLHLAISLHPNDKTILDFLEVAKKTKLSYLREEKKAFSKLFK